MNVHDLFIALSQQNRKARVKIKDNKIYVGGKVLGASESDAQADGDDGNGSDEGDA